MEIKLIDVIIFLMNIAMKNIPLKYINIIIIHKYEKSSYKNFITVIHQVVQAEE